MSLCSVKHMNKGAVLLHNGVPVEPKNYSYSETVRRGLKFVLAHAQAGVDHDRSRKRPRCEHFDVPEEPATMFEAGKQYVLHRHG